MANEIGNALNSLSDPAQNPAIQIENQSILDFHALSRNCGTRDEPERCDSRIDHRRRDIWPWEDRRGQLLTDTAQAPGDTVNGAGPVNTAADIVTDAGQTIGAGGGFIEGVGTDLAHPNLVPEAVDGLGDFADGNAIGQFAGAVTDGLVPGVGGIGGGNGGGGGNGDALVSAGWTDGDSPILNAGVMNQTRWAVADRRCGR